jgi:hypothetical protein
VCVCVCLDVCVCACARACVRACVRAYVQAKKTRAQATAGEEEDTCWDMLAERKATSSVDNVSPNFLSAVRISTAWSA